MFEKYGFENEDLVIITTYNNNIVIAPSEQNCKTNYYDIYPDLSRAITLIDTNDRPFVFLTYMENDKSRADAILFRKVDNTYEISLAEDGWDGLQTISDYFPYDKRKLEQKKRGELC